MSDGPLEFLPVPGARLASHAAGIRYRGRDDLVLIEVPSGSAGAAVFTRNAFCAAPVVLARRHLAATAPRYLLINSGNANAGNGEDGMDAARLCCRALAERAGCRPEQVLPFSTGVIGQSLPTEPFVAAYPQLLAGLTETGWPAAARAIMTTDTVPKLVSRRIRLADGEATVTGMAKGAGMICPDMATMLAFVATDLAVSRQLLQETLEHAVDVSFNAITVDGDTSTNDACVFLATGVAHQPPATDPRSDIARVLREAVTEVCTELATAIVRDGEGATKLVTVEVREARDREEARRVAYTIAHSPLVKTALFASDPNWGRILAAIGRAGLDQLDIDRVEIYLDQVCIVRVGSRAAEYTEEAGARVMEQPEFGIGVSLGRGEAEARVLTCDFSFDYVRINAEYRT